MAMLKCKMCGGNLELIPGENICECENCGSRQTVPDINDERKAKLYERANKLRFNCDFDKAATVYENIVNDFPDDAESYWGLILCKYGIEYVDDPATGKKVPTCHRSSFDSLMDDPDFEMVMENAAGEARSLYRSEAKQIEELRKGIIEVSGKEAPYDIFICYKETADDGQRTIDSVLAQDVYDALTEKGYRVFFSRISLEDKLGTEYEPYIFAALNSAKIMLAFGTSYDYYNAVWVKNEWSRFLKLMALDKEKILIPCFKGIDAYDIPKEFSRFQAQDLGKVGATQDLIRGIDKILRPHPEEIEKTIINDTSMSVISAQTTAFLKRGYMALEDGDFGKANGFFEQVLNYDAENSQAYWGFLLSSYSAKNIEELLRIIEKFIINAEKTENVEVNCTAIVRKLDSMKEVFAGFSDEELKYLLEDIKPEKEQKVSIKYYEDLARELDTEKISRILNNRILEKAEKYADDRVDKSINELITEIKKFANEKKLEEEETLSKFINEYEREYESLLSVRVRKSFDAVNNYQIYEDPDFNTLPTAILISLGRENEVISALKNWILSKEIKNENEISLDVVKITRQVDEEYGLLSQLSEEEIKELFESVNNKKAVESGLQYYDNVNVEIHRLGYPKIFSEAYRSWADNCTEKRAVNERIIDEIKRFILERREAELNNIEEVKENLRSSIQNEISEKIAKARQRIESIKTKRQATIDTYNDEINQLQAALNKKSLFSSEKKLREKIEQLQKDIMAINGPESADLLKQIIKVELIPSLKQNICNIIRAKTGEEIIFGRINNMEDKSRPIVWNILEITDNKAFILAKNEIGALPYNNSLSPTNWEKCTLRKSLDTLSHTIFTDVELKALIEVENINPGNAKGGSYVYSGLSNNTFDKLFIPSISDMRWYFKKDEKRRARPFGIDINSEYDPHNDKWHYWLRNTDQDTGRAVVVWGSGAIGLNGMQVNVNSNVRPACWIDLKYLDSLINS